MSSIAAAPREPERLYVLDVLRGMALLGMFLVHFSEFSSGGNAFDQAYKTGVWMLLEERAWATFAILFGVGFAIQLRRADARGASFVPSYLRRLAMLAVIGFAAHAFFGFNVLFGYAVWGVPLLLFRRWSVRALVVALMFSTTSWSIYALSTTAYRVAKHGEKAAIAYLDSSDTQYRAFREANEKAQQATSYRAVLAARLEHMRWFYAQPYSFLPVFTLTLFLLGVLGLRLRVFDEPERHRRLIVTLAIFGLMSWAAEWWVWPALPKLTGLSLMSEMFLTRLRMGLGLVRSMWLAFTYIGIVLLLVAHDPKWLWRLGVFAWTGRMALTNYMIQIAILDLTFSKYALGLVVRPIVGLGLAVALFVADGYLSRWWLARFRYGPLEWLWRSATYATWQPLRIGHARPVVAERLAVIN